MTQTIQSPKIDEKKILNTVMNTSKSLIDAIKFELDYKVFVSQEQEEKTAKALKDYREKEWKKCMKKAKNNKKIAYKFYASKANELFA